jgi:hypothetical protein
MTELCIHHKEIYEYGLDALVHPSPWELWEWEFDNSRGCFAGHPTWETHIIFRRKPRTLNINGFDVPYPLEVEPKKGDLIWVATPHQWEGEKYCYDQYYYSTLHSQLSDGRLIHTTEEAADLHGRAMASFFKS